MTFAIPQHTLDLALLDSAHKGDLPRMTQSLLEGADPLSYSKRNALMLAVSAGHQHCVEALLRMAPQLALTRDSMGNSPLMIAIWGEHPSIARLLFSFSDLSAHDNQGVTLLMCAAMRDDLESLLHLLPHANARFRLRGTNVLMLAAQHAAARSVQALLAHSDLFARCEEKNQTALEMAAEGGHELCVRVLLDAVLVHLQEPDWAGEAQAAIDSAFERSRQEGHWGCIEMLAPYGSRSLVDETYRRVGANLMPQWAAHLEREILAASLAMAPASSTDVHPISIDQTTRISGPRRRL